MILNRMLQPFEELMGTLDMSGKLDVRATLCREIYKLKGKATPDKLYRLKVIQAACPRYDDMVRELATLSRIGQIRKVPAAKGATYMTRS